VENKIKNLKAKGYKNIYYLSPLEV
jgi:hypothetical protein